MRTDMPKTIYLKDYKPAPCSAEHIDMTFRIEEARTIVTAVTQYKKESDEPLVLNGEHVVLRSIALESL